MSDQTSMGQLRRSANDAQEAFVDKLLHVVRRFAPGAQKIEKLVRLSGGASQEIWRSRFSMIMASIE
jgi:hypothetical protein